MKKIVIFGVGELSELAHYYFSREEDSQVVAFTVSREHFKEDKFLGLDVIPEDKLITLFPPNEYYVFVAVGYRRLNKDREEIFSRMKLSGYKLYSYISKNSAVADNVKIGENCFIFENNTIQPFCTIEDNCIVWSGNHIGHHSTIKKNTFITSHVVISGGVTVGDNSFLGVNATIRDHICIGKYAVIGAGTLILKDCEENKVFIGTETKASKVPSDKLRGI